VCSGKGKKFTNLSPGKLKDEIFVQEKESGGPTAQRGKKRAAVNDKRLTQKREKGKSCRGQRGLSRSAVPKTKPGKKNSDKQQDIEGGKREGQKSGDRSQDT